MSRQHFVSRHKARSAGQSKRNARITAVPRPLVLALITSLLGCALPGLAAGRESRPRSVLADVPGLENRVTYSETKIPLGELVAKVAADTGVPLTAARDVADEPVAVVVTDFPARELLEQLADLLDYQWSPRSGVQTFRRSGPADASRSRHADSTSPERPNARAPERSVGYEIWQDLSSKQREEALRQALYASAEQRFEEELAVCRELSGKSQEEMLRLWDEARRWYEHLEKLAPRERQALVNTPEGHRQHLRHRLATRLWSPIWRSLAGFMNRLLPEQWAALRAGRQIVFASEPQPGKLPLPPDVLRVFRTSRPSVSPPGAPAFPGDTPEAEEKDRQWERKAQQLWDQAEQYQVTFRLRWFESRWGDTGSIQFVAWPEPFRGGKRLGTTAESRGLVVFTMSQQALPPTEDAPGRRALLQQDPVLSIKKPFQPDTRPYVDPLFPRTTRTFRLLPEVLPELARTYGVNIIADSYWKAPGITGLSSVAGPRPLFEVLDGLNTTDDNRGAPFVWDLGFSEAGKGSLLRIRNRRWFVERPREIPLRIVRRWTALTDRLGALPLDECLSAATTLTDVQIDTLEGLLQTGVFPPQLDDLRGLGGAIWMLRLYERLSPAQRQALQAGQSLRTAKLFPALQPFVLAQLNRAHFWSFPRPDVAQWGGGHLSFASKPDVRLREQRGRSVTWRLESAPTPRGVTPADAVTRFPVTRLRMEIHYGAQAPAAAGVIVAADSAAPG